MFIQPARELGALNVIQEMFRAKSPNVGSFVKVNFEQKEIQIADEYAKVIIGQKQPIQANFEPPYFVSVSPASAFGGLFWKELSYIEILDDSTETHYDLVFGDFLFDSAHFIRDEARHPPCRFSVGRNAEYRKSSRIRYGFCSASGANYDNCH